MTFSLALLATAALLLANAFFVASEFALVKMRPSRLEELASGGDRRARIALSISRRLDAFLSANQLGITLASLALGWIGEPAFAAWLGPLFASLGDWQQATTHTVSVVVSLALITALHTVLGELVPKSLAIQRTEPVALWTAAPLRLFYTLMFPLIWLLNAAARATLAVLGLGRVTDVEMLHSPEELRLILQRVELDPGTRRVIDRLFDYSHRVAQQVMTLRRDVVVLDAAQTWEHNLARALAHQYTRYPLVEGPSDVVLGYVHIKDIVAVLGAARPMRSMRDLARAPVFAFQDTPAEELRREFLRRRIHMAVIMTPTRTFAGVVTLEDLLEEFIGEIRDEQDTDETPPLVRRPGGRFEVDGRLTLDVAARELGLVVAGTPPRVDTVGDFVKSQLGEQLELQASIVHQGVRWTVLELRDGRVQRLAGEPASPN